MDRTVAFRAAIVFIAVSLFSGAIGLSAFAPAAEVVLVISASISTVLLALGLAMPSYSAVPVRARSRRL